MDPQQIMDELARKADEARAVAKARDPRKAAKLLAAGLDGMRARIGTVNWAAEKENKR